MTKPRVVLFDLDGTLIDTAADFAVTLNRLLADHDRPPLPYAAIRATVSNGARALVTLGFGLSPEQQGFDALHRQLLAYYSSQLSTHSQLFPALEECLDWLENNDLHWGIVTNKPELYTTPLLTALALQQRAAAVICPEHVRNSKPDPEPLLLACQQLDCPPQQAVYVGDHARDIEAGRRAGMPTIAASYGYLADPEEAQGWQADYIASQPADILRILQALVATH